MKDYFPDISETTICIIGMGYVGLPLTIEFSKLNSSKKNSSNKFKRIIGFDIDEQRLNLLRLTPAFSEWIVNKARLTNNSSF